MKLSYIEKKYYTPILLKSKDFGNTVHGAVSKDGQVFMFDLMDVKPVLDMHYPVTDKEGHYFNESKDRYIAEFRFDRVVTNPQFVWRHYDTISEGTSNNLSTT